MTKNDRLWPSPTHHAKVILDGLREALTRVAGQVGGRLLLDFGAGSSPYAPLFFNFERIVTADLPGRGADLEVVDGRIPVDDCAFDLVLSTQVLEHVPDPAAYLKEARRVLASNGRLVLSTHGIYRYHPDPEDYWRWTRQGLERQLSLCGFDVIETHSVVSGLGASLTMLSQFLSHALPTKIRPAFHAVSQMFLKALERLVARYPWRDAAVYVVVARRDSPRPST
jgi:SAM-dependent methyltransferase